MPSKSESTVSAISRSLFRVLPTSLPFWGLLPPIRVPFCFFCHTDTILPKKARFAAEKREFAEEKGHIGDINIVNNKAVPRELLKYTIGWYKIFLDPREEWVTTDGVVDEICYSE